MGCKWLRLYHMEWSGGEERGYNNHDLLRGMRARMSSGIVKIAEEEEGGGIYPHPGKTNCALACVDRNSAIWGWKGQSRAAFVA